jgi:hypothetical protein
VYVRVRVRVLVRVRVRIRFRVRVRVMVRVRVTGRVKARERDSAKRGEGQCEKGETKNEECQMKKEAGGKDALSRGGMVQKDV